jgi:hypothetical protein
MTITAAGVIGTAQSAVEQLKGFAAKADLPEIRIDEHITGTQPLDRTEHGLLNLATGSGFATYSLFSQAKLEA